MSLLLGAHNLMLKKEICKKCWNKKHIVDRDRWGWTAFDESRWRHGIIICPPEYRENIEGEYGDNTRKITEQPPTNCPFLLENILNEKE